MLSKLALALSLLIVLILAIVAGTTVLNGGDGSDQDESADGGSGTELDSSVVTELDQPVATAPSAATVEVGGSGEPLAVACWLPVAGQTPLLVVFENRSNMTDDFLAQVVVVYNGNSQVEAVASAEALRPGEQRAVVPSPWFDSNIVSECRVQAIQQGEHLILLGQDGP